MIPQTVIDEIVYVYDIPEDEIIEDITALFEGVIPPADAQIWDVVDWPVYFDC